MSWIDLGILHCFFQNLLILILNIRCAFGFLRLNKYRSENQSCKWTNKDELKWERHNEVSTVSHKIIQDKISGKTVSVVYTEDAGECNLPDDGECLDGKDDKDRSVSWLNNPECAHLRKVSGYEICK